MFMVRAGARAVLVDKMNWTFFLSCLAAHVAMGSQTDSTDVISTLAAIPIVETARIVKEKGDRLFIELQYNVKDYWSEEAFKYQYEQIAMLDTATSTVDFSSIGPPFDPDCRKFKSISPSGSYTIIGVCKKTVEGEPSNYLHVRLRMSCTDSRLVA